jgi:hypothetical protein
MTAPHRICAIMGNSLGRAGVFIERLIRSAPETSTSGPFRQPATAALRLVMLVNLIALLTPPAAAIPVQRPFGDFPKAIVFTGPNVPPQYYPIRIADGNQGAADTKPGFILTPLGDGSWAVLATVYPGSNYQYYFEYRVPQWDGADSAAAFLTTEGDARNEDQNRGRSILVPAGAGNGYVVYNAFGDRSVWGGQSADTTLSIANPFLAQWRGSSLISVATDGDTSGRDETNNYGVTALQVGADKTQLTWNLTMGGGGFVPQVEGASYFSALGALPLYGFEILRAESNPVLSLAALNYQNVTAAITGGPIYSDDDSAPWNTPIRLTDSTVVAWPDSTFVYIIKTVNAYGMRNTETAQLAFAGGYGVVTWANQAVAVDGTIDRMFSNPIATDSRGDQNEKNLDLTRMWATKDQQNWYLGLEIAADIYATPWGRYFFLIDTTGDSLGAPDFRHSSLGSNAKKIAFPNRKPEYAAFVYRSNTTNGPPADRIEVLQWTGSGWSNLGSQLVAASTNGETSWIECAISFSAIPDTPRIWLEGFSSGNDQDNPARDVINKLAGEPGNDEWNVSSWTSATIGRLSVSTPFPPQLMGPISVTATAWDTRGYVTYRWPAMNINLIDHFDVFFDSDLAKVEAGSPSVRLRTMQPTQLVAESTGLIGGVRYFAKVFAVAASGESAGSHIAYCDARALSDTIITTAVDSGGVSIIEVNKVDLNYTDSFYIIEILDYNEFWQMANFTDTARWAQLQLVHAANEKTFFDPALDIITLGAYPDTYSPLRQVTVYRSDGTRAPADYFDRVTLRIPYRTMADSKTLADARGLMYENTLVIRKLDEAGANWIVPSTEKTQWVQTDSDHVVIVTSEFSIWTVLAGAGTITNLDRVVVYPNPFNARDYISAGHPLPARITFAFIPTSTERIEIFNIAGERVRTLDPSDASEFETQGGFTIAKWDAKNDYGREVASGVYVFWIRANGQVKIGKVAVIK